jgi:hypothetical protein
VVHSVKISSHRIALSLLAFGETITAGALFGKLLIGAGRRSMADFGRRCIQKACRN